jgi:2-C-methyl-D-erythritol 4-phosphate cytidylyltransferase
MSDGGRFWVIVPAAGIGSRFGGLQPKQYVMLHGKPIIEHTLSALLRHDKISHITVAIRSDDLEWEKVNYAGCADTVTKVTGGASRLHSVYNCLLSLQGQAHEHDWVLVHDAVRPIISLGLLDRLFAELTDHPVGGLLGVPQVDTVKKVNADLEVMSTIPRDSVWRAQTPQMFRYNVLLDALSVAIAEALPVTDESSAVELQGLRPKIVMGDVNNIKVTMPDDIFMLSSSLVRGDSLCE